MMKCMTAPGAEYTCKDYIEELESYIDYLLLHMNLTAFTFPDGTVWARDDYGNV
jgi:hypothetical protein